MIGSIGSSGMTVLDFAPLIQLLVQALGAAIIGVIGWWLQGHVKDENSRKTILDAATNGVNHAINRVEGATASGNMSVSVQSSVAAMAARYALAAAPAAIKRLGISNEQIARLVVSKMPESSDKIDDSTLSVITSHVGSGPGAAAVPPTDYKALADALRPMLQQDLHDAFAKVYPAQVAPASQG